MPSGPLINEHLDAAIRQDLYNPDLSLLDIARKHGVSKNVVWTRSKKYMPERAAHRRSQTENATRVVTADMKARRARLAEKFLEKSEELLDMMNEMYELHNFDKNGDHNSKLVTVAPSTDLRNLMTAAAVALDKSILIDRHDTAGNEGSDEVSKWVDRIKGDPRNA